MVNIKYFSESFYSVLIILTAWVHAQDSDVSSVKIWEQDIIIPTYEIGKPDPNPRFYEGRVHQGAQGRVYPYPMLDVLTDNLIDKTYRIVYLENEYVRISVLPELGGRLFSAFDKTNDYNFFYRQHVIKPALIGMLGAWISGGIEWNVFHHHRNTTMMPVDYVLKENPDGSKTVWVGEIERRHRMKWIVGLTLYPGKSYIEATIKIFNRTPMINSILYWANPAVHIDKTYQVIFPPQTEYVTYHAKNAFTEWPNSYTPYRGHHYNGTDISWYKNLPDPVSFFAWNYNDDYFAGYDHGKDAGTVYVANHYIAPGKKLWTWGYGATGQRWDKMLSDEDGPYIEIMGSAYSDNQPDYSWIQPYETKVIKQNWYPIRQLQGLKYANLSGAVNLVMSPDNIVKIRINTTSQYLDAKVVLEARGNKLFEQTVDINPAKPYTKDINTSPDINLQDLKVLLFSSEGKELLSYQEEKKPGNLLPKKVEPPPAPGEINSVEALYLTGLRLEQFHSARRDPYLYYEEAIKRDPDNAAVNLQLGISYCKRALYTKAEEKLRIAIKRVSRNYTSPKDGESYYYLGIALKLQGKYNAAYDVLYKATWSSAWHSAAYYQLAEIDCKRGNFNIALEHIHHSLLTNMLNTKALNLKAAIQRKLGHLDKAKQTVLKVISIDPLDFWGLNELYLIEEAKNNKASASEQLQILKKMMREDEQSYLELGTDYGNCGLWDEAINILSRLDISKDNKGNSYPLIYYYLGYYWHKKGENKKSLEYYHMANKMPPEYCFPFRAETKKVLAHALALNKSDARVLYYLGNLIYENEPEKAIRYWESSKDLDATLATVHRNLGLAYSKRINSITDAISSYEQAMACGGDDARIYYELCKLYNKAGTPIDNRLRADIEIILRRDDALSQEIILYLQQGKYEEAIDLLTTHHFHTWEGGGEMHDVYVDAHLLRGMRRFKNKEYSKALTDYQAALEYPKNLEVGRPENDIKSSRTYYFLGSAYRKLGEYAKARECFTKTISFEVDRSHLLYYQGLAFRELNEEAEAIEKFDELIKIGGQIISQDKSADFFAKFGEKEIQESRMASAHYLMGLGFMGKDLKNKAKEDFEKALSLRANHLWAAVMLDELR